MSEELLSKYAAEVEAKFAGSIVARGDFRGEVTFVVTPESSHEVLAFCQRSLGFDLLMDISSIDNLGVQPRFEVVYEIVRSADDTHLRIKVPVAEGGEVASACDLWKAADWHEREVYDMMGIQFSGHPDLRRILMWDGYPYYPLRKDFPLAGKPTEMPEVAFTDVAPMVGGPFVAKPGEISSAGREPKARGES